MIGDIPNRISESAPSTALAPSPQKPWLAATDKSTGTTAPTAHRNGYIDDGGDGNGNAASTPATYVSNGSIDGLADAPAAAEVVAGSASIVKSESTSRLGIVCI